MTQEIFEQINRLTPTGHPPVRAAADYSSLKLMLDDVIEVVKELKEQGSFKATAIYDLAESHSLKHPLHVILQETEETVIASWPELHLYAEGGSPNDAMASLKNEIIALYDDLISTPEPELGILPKRWLNTLKSVIKVNA